MDAIVIGGVEYRLFDHLYAVSDHGAFLRRTGKGFTSYTPKLRPDGYLNVGRKRLAHRVVASCWVNNPSNAKCVHHINGKRSDNRAVNLEWVTQKEHISERHSGQIGRNKMTEKQKQRLRSIRLGATQSEEARIKISKSLKAAGHRPPSWEGKQHSEETKTKMRENNNMNRACKVFGVEYPSFAAAARVLGERPLSLRKRCFSKNFPDYKAI